MARFNFGGDTNFGPACRDTPPAAACCKPEPCCNPMQSQCPPKVHLPTYPIRTLIGQLSRLQAIACGTIALRAEELECPVVRRQDQLDPIKD